MKLFKRPRREAQPEGAPQDHPKDQPQEAAAPQLAPADCYSAIPIVAARLERLVKMQPHLAPFFGLEPNAATMDTSGDARILGASLQDEVNICCEHHAPELGEILQAAHKSKKRKMDSYQVGAAPRRVPSLGRGSACPAAHPAAPLALRAGLRRGAGCRAGR
jgi:hypothetical protein